MYFWTAGPSTRPYARRRHCAFAGIYCPAFTWQTAQAPSGGLHISWSRWNGQAALAVRHRICSFVLGHSRMGICSHFGRLPVKKILMTSFLAGLLPGVIAPILFPFVNLIVEGHFPSWEVYPAAAITIAFFGALAGTIGSIVLGVPVLLALERRNLNRPLVVAVVGAVFGVLLFLLFVHDQTQASLAQSWPIAVFFAVLAAACGYCASKLSRPSKPLQTPSPPSRRSG